MKRVAFLVGLVSLLTPPASAEIVVAPNALAGAFYAYEHPALRSLVFVSPEARQMAILPPAPVFITSPPLLMRAPTAMPTYPPVIMQPGINVPAHPGNRDNVNYILQRAHGFSQNLYREDASFYSGAPAYGYGWLTYGSAYPPVATPGFNQPARPSNRDNATYLMDRAHRFSMDGYRQP